MKNKYLELEIEVILLSMQDVITASSDQNATDDPYDPGNNWWDQ